MTGILVQEAASRRIDEIYRYSRATWGDARAKSYIRGLFTAFEGIEANVTLSRPVPAEFGVDAYCFRYQKHIVYWKRLATGEIGIVTVLHERMHQIDRFKGDFP